MKKYRNCQSCGMPLSKDPEKGGTNADGSKSIMYCSYCYKEGNFTQPDFTAKKMQQFCKEKMKEMGFPGFLAGFFTMGIPKLERWRNG
ncbi:MAG: zinc ribbon domain-containing protein [Cytophagales bacterium]|nr:zinc ribbon domain-containing protein [Cytophagales bacterium]